MNEHLWEPLEHRDDDDPDMLPILGVAATLVKQCVDHHDDPTGVRYPSIPYSGVVVPSKLVAKFYKLSLKVNPISLSFFKSRVEAHLTRALADIAVVKEELRELKEFKELVMPFVTDLKAQRDLLLNDTVSPGNDFTARSWDASPSKRARTDLGAASGEAHEVEDFVDIAVFGQDLGDECY